MIRKTMKSSIRNVLSVFLLITLAWMWNCDLRASVGFFCPDHLSISEFGIDEPASTLQSKTAIPDCHKNTSNQNNSSGHSDCSHCLELEWETANHYFPDTNQYAETMSCVVWNEIFSCSYYTRNRKTSPITCSPFPKITTLDSHPSALETNLRFRI